MKKLIFLFLLGSGASFSQNNEVNTRVSIEFTQDFGTVFANSKEYERTNYELNMAGTGIRVSGSIFVGGDMFLEPFATSNFRKGEGSNLTHFHYDEAYVSDMSSINSEFNRELITSRETQYSTFSASFGFLLMKPVSRYFSVGGGFQGSFRTTHFTNIDTYNLGGLNYTNSWEEDLSGFAFSVPILCRGYVPVSKNHFISLFAGLNINQKNPWISSGIGYTLQSNKSK